MMDLSMMNCGLSLPDTFPEGYQASGFNRTKLLLSDKLNDYIDSSASISKIHQQVSAALLRIGFDHIVEHTISMRDLATDYNAKMPPKDIDVLSIDIANPKHMIAIEVDGPSHFLSNIDGAAGIVSTSGVLKHVSRTKAMYKHSWDANELEINGRTALKYTFLSYLGWTVLQVPYWEWLSIKDDINKQDEYLLHLLKR
jgi:RAP domain